MRAVHEKPRPPEGKNAASGQQRCADSIPTTLRAIRQAEQTTPAAFWRKAEPNRCTDCGKLIGDDWTGYDNDRMSDRGRLLCDPCAMRRELSR